MPNNDRDDDMKGDGYWQDVEAAYRDCVAVELNLTHDELWETAKRRARLRYLINIALDKVRRGEKTYGQALLEDVMPKFLGYEEN